MDPLIEGYIQETFHSDTCDTLRRCFELFDLFEYPDAELNFINLLMTEDHDSPQAIQDHFTTFIHEQLDYILHAHLVKLNESVYLHQKVALVDGLFAIQHLNDYSSIVHALESSLDDEEKFSEVISHCCSLQPMAVMSVLQSVDGGMLNNLKQFINEREVEEGKTMTSFTELQKKIIDNIRLFKMYMGDRHAIAFMMVDANVIIGQPLERYVTFIEDVLKNDDHDQLAIDIFSLLLMTDEGINSPIQCFRKHTGLLLDDLHSVSRIDTLLLGIEGDFEKFKVNIKMTKDQA